MTTALLSPLPDRGIVRITGEDAATLLDGLVTTSLTSLDDHGATHTALLSPQGKILFDFFLIATSDALLIDIDRTSIEALIKRLGFYRLRADVTFEDVSGNFIVAALWPGQVTLPGGIIAYADPRHQQLGMRLILTSERLNEIPAVVTESTDYHAHRINLGVPEAIQDYQLGNALPHEAIYDQLGSVDFRKGCFIGQEVVSRMQHRGTARRRAIRIAANMPLKSGASVMAGEAEIGWIGSANEKHAIAVLRLDRAAEATAKGQALTAEGVTLTIDAPEWITFDLANGRPAETA